MTVRELAAAYPTVPNAVAFTELFLEGVILSDMREMALSVDKAVWACQQLADVPVNNDPAMELQRRIARAEMDRPEFATYLAGKLGAM
jgi:hypothetical protein